MLNLTPELINQLDKFEPPPSELAAKIYKILNDEHPELTNYELRCFAVEYLCLEVIHKNMDYAEGSIKLLAKDFYFAHYYRLSCQASSDLNEIAKGNTTSTSPSPDSKKLFLLK